MNVNEDFNYAFALSRQCLRVFGVWPDPFTTSSDFHRPSIRFIIVTCILCLYVIVPQLTNMILSWGNVARMVEYVASANYSLMALCKLVGTWYHGETLRTLMTSVVTDWMTSKNDRERNTMLNIARRGRILSLSCYVCSVCALSFYLSFNLQKFYRNMHQSQRTLVYGSTYPYNIHRSPNYEITFFTQLSGGISTAFINSTVDSFVSILLLHICAQLINLRSALNDLVDKLAEGFISSSRFKKGLAAITIRHKHLIRNAKTVDDCYSAVLFVHMFAATFQLCFESFQYYFQIISNHLDVSLVKMGFLSFYVVLVLTHLYIYCYSAEKLLTESTNMAYGVYECKWYDISSKDAKNLMFMLYRSTVPLRLTAGKFGAFSLEMFGTTVKTSMGYLSVLLTMMD
ncbi:odorant receptor 4-like [Temnothorax nylanderi]|uniref:odorant receptor 4-like n=1 Tax=Temnothorax nylanderi TaxID=102681 RepID=UPI003A883326